MSVKASCEDVLKVLKVSTSSQILALSDERWDFIFMTIDIYTASAYYKPPKNRMNREYILHSYDSLPDDFKEWVLENFIRMIESPTKAEQEFERHLTDKGILFEKQVFFRINGKSYFLDFYIPSKNLAIELDGGIHKEQKQYDKTRNKKFMSIGISTMRLPNAVAFANNIDKAVKNRKRYKKRPNAKRCR